MCLRSVLLIAGLVFISLAYIAQAEDEAFVTTRILAASTATEIAVVAEKACKKRGYQVSVAVVDRYGNLLAFVRDPLSGAHTITIAQHKAYTAATFQGPTIELSEQMAFLKGTPKLSLVGGGVPVQVGGFMYGAVGISGAPQDKIPGDIDDACARAGIDAVTEELEFGGM